MGEGLTRDEDTALRCLAALSDTGPLSDEHQDLLENLVSRDRRSVIRREGTKIPRQRSTGHDGASQHDTGETPVPGDATVPTQNA